MIPLLKVLAIPPLGLPMLLQSCDGHDADVLLGILMRDRVVLTATATGIITDLPVDEGTEVEAGAILVQIEDTLQQASLEVARARLAEAEADLERVAQGSPVAVLLTGDRPHARIYIPEPARVRLSVGDPAAIRLDWTDAVFEGRLRWISDEPAFTPYCALNREQRSRLFYLAEVDRPAEAARLPTGVPVNAELP